MYKRKLKWVGMYLLKDSDVARNNLLAFLKNLFPVTVIFDETILPMLQAYEAKKRFKFAKPGEEIRIALWVARGYVRFYVKSTNKRRIAVEETIKIGIAGSIVLVKACFFNGKKCPCYIDIVKGSIVIPFTRDFYDQLKEKAPETEGLANSVLSQEIPDEFDRDAMMRMDGQARYDLFMDMYGEEINQYLTQKQIASFLGMTTTHMANLRAERNRRRIQEAKIGEG